MKIGFFILNFSSYLELVIASFVKIGAVKAKLLWEGKWIFLRTFQTYCPISVKFGMSDMQIMLFSIYEFLGKG
jgi:hypothetical protein